VEGHHRPADSGYVEPGRPHTPFPSLSRHSLHAWWRSTLSNPVTPAILLRRSNFHDRRVILHWLEAAARWVTLGRQDTTSDSAPVAKRQHSTPPTNNGGSSPLEELLAESPF